MNRYISLALAAVILMFSFAVPSYAAENNDLYYEVLDYSFVNGGSNNMSDVFAGSNTYSFELPFYSRSFGFDILIQSTAAITDANILNRGYSYDLNVTSLGGNIYKLTRGPLNLQGDLDIEIISSNSGWVNFLSIKFFVTSNTSYNVPASGLISFGNGEEDNFYYNSDDDYLGVTIPGTSSWQNDSYRAYISIDDYYLYDRIDLQLYLSKLDLNSLSITCQNANVPFSYSFVSAGNGMEAYLVNITIDCSNFTYSGHPFEIAVLGRVASLDSAVCYIGILYSSGFVYGDLPSESRFFFDKLIDFLTLQYNKLSGWINNVSSSVSTAIGSWGQKIVDAINGDASAADKFKDQVDQSNQELNDMAAVMDSFTTPDLNSINVDVGSFVNPADLSSLTAPMGMLFESNIVTTCIMISIILGTVMFVLYGKR